jgi:FlaA1/EpsC-like NDP-sugar epimerase
MSVGSLRNRHLFIADLLMVGLATYFSFVLRLENFTLGDGLYWPTSVMFLGIGLLIIPLVFWRFGMYARYWRYASVEELVLLVSASFVAILLVSVLSALVAPLTGLLSLPRSIPFIFLMLFVAASAAPRLGVRLLARRQRSQAVDRDPLLVVVIGAGDAGTMIVRELQQVRDAGMEVFCFLDDDPRKRNMLIHNVPVLGGRNAIAEIAAAYPIDLVIIAMPTAPGKIIRELRQRCQEIGVETKTVPALYELVNGRVGINQLRDVQIEDLLRRDVVQTDLAAVHAMVSNRRVLVTGGGGSIGSELCRQILRYKPETLIVLGHGENSVFAIQQHLGQLAQDYGIDPARIVPEIADTRFRDRVQAVFEQYRPEIVFHVAAHKHVPLMEANPAEAITNNVIGTQNVLRAAQAVGTEHFVMVSSDKAVNPTSIMGASKRVAEILVHQAAIVSGRPYVAVRLGNVLGSRGSAVLTFKQQIAAGGPVTVTHPDMQRFFMTIPEAVQLILQAAALGCGGEIFVLDMGEPVKIVDLARELVELSGLKVGEDIDIVFTGVRPGEKLYEELFIPGENYRRTTHEKIYIASHASDVTVPDLDALIDSLHQAALHGDRTLIVNKLQHLIPEYRSKASSADGPAAVAVWTHPQHIYSTYGQPAGSAGPAPA